MSEEEKKLTNEDLFVDPDNIEALRQATKPKDFIYPLTLPSMQKLGLPMHVCSHIFGMEAGRGAREPKKDAGYDPDQDRKQWIKRINPALRPPWQFIDDKDPKTPAKEPEEWLSEKKIPVSLVLGEDWVKIIQAAFPGYLNATATNKIIRDEAAAIRGGCLQSVSGGLDAEQGAD